MFGRKSAVQKEIERNEHDAGVYLAASTLVLHEALEYERSAQSLREMGARPDAIEAVEHDQLIMTEAGRLLKTKAEACLGVNEQLRERYAR